MWVGPYKAGSVVPIRAISGVFVRPIGTSPVARNRRANALSVRGRKSRSRKRAHPHVVRLTGLTCLAVLEQERHAGEGTVERYVGRVAPRSLELSMDHRVECGIQPFRAGDRGVDQLDRFHLAAPHELTECGGVEIFVVVHESSARFVQCGTRPPLTRIV